jgi:hypothetical protein
MSDLNSLIEAQFTETLRNLLEHQERLLVNLTSQIEIQKLMIEVLREVNTKHMKTIKELLDTAGDTHQADVPLTKHIFTRCYNSDCFICNKREYFKKR